MSHDIIITIISQRGRTTINNSFVSKEPDVFTRTYTLMGKSGGGTQLRFNYFPRITDNIEVKTNQIRFGEHTDYGAITLLFQDEAGGLEVRKIIRIS